MELEINKLCIHEYFNNMAYFGQIATKKRFCEIPNLVRVPFTGGCGEGRSPVSKALITDLIEGRFHERDDGVVQGGLGGLKVPVLGAPHDSADDFCVTSGRATNPICSLWFLLATPLCRTLECLLFGLTLKPSLALKLPS